MAILSIVAVFVLLQYSSAVPQLYPFGVDVDDFLLQRTLDGSSAGINLNFSSFPFFDELYSILFVNNNGHISFEVPVFDYLPLPLPLRNLKLIAPYWADSDTQPEDGGFVWFRETDDSGLLSRAKQEIQMAFVNRNNFVPVSLFIVTWERIGYFSEHTDKRNTFQCVMATDGFQSFVLFLYEDIQWTTGDAGGLPALAGINAGDGLRFFTIPGSLTNEIISITETSNVGVPGMWVFRVDQEDIAIGGCSSEENAPLLLAPRSGNVLGGTAVRVGGPCFQMTSRVACVFDSTEVEGVIVNEMIAVCISPPLTDHGRRAFQLRVYTADDTLVYVAESFFYSLSVEDGPSLIVDYRNPLLLPERKMEIRWSPDRLIPLDDPRLFLVDICLYEFDLEDGSWKEMAVLHRSTPNDGAEIVTIPAIQNVDRVVPVAFQVSGSLKQNFTTANDNRSIAWGQLVFYSMTDSDNLLKPLCESWFSNQTEGIGQALLDRLPSCAPTVSRARLKSVFGEDMGQRSRANQLFHPRAERCFRQTTFTEENLGSGQQCCYNNQGDLITGNTMEAGSVDRFAPVGLQETWAHFKEDLLPLVFCCLAFECQTYHTGRPADKGENCPVIPPACVYGDPHIVTLDGLKYTFNGKGEFILIETEDNGFELQGRMIQATDLNGTEVEATVFSAIVGRQSDSDTVQFQISSVRGIDTIVNGELIEFDELGELEFNNVTVRNKGNDSLSATFSSGARLEVRAENGIISVLLVSMPDMFRAELLGLMGNFNGNTSDDLLPRSSSVPLSVDSSLEDVHNLFGITWIIDDPEDSLFTYRAGQNWTTFYDPDFLPVFVAVFNDPVLQAEAEALCGDDQFCLYDVATTGRTDIGLSTLIGNEEFEEIVELSMPIVCDPPCVNGACVSNDTCNCAPEFTGLLCTEPIICEPPCVNGVCVANDTCDCDSGFIGPRCTDVPVLLPCFIDSTCNEMTSLLTVEDCCLQDGLSFELNDTCMACIVFGWFQSSFRADESRSRHDLQVGYLKGGDDPSASSFTMDIAVIDETAVFGADRDFTVNPLAFRLSQRSIQRIQVNFRVDSVAFEVDETFSMVLNPRTSPPSGPNVFFMTTVNLTIIDIDVVKFFFTEDDFRANEIDGVIPVVVTKDKLIARNVTLTITPLNLTSAMNMGINVTAFNLPPNNSFSPIEAKSYPEDRLDFRPDVLTLTYTADEEDSVLTTDKRAPVVIKNDAFNEANIEVFFVSLALSGEVDKPEAIDLIQRNASVCRIVDNDVIRIGFENASYTFEEAETTITNVIYLTKQDGVISEQTFSIVVTALDSSPPGVQTATFETVGVVGDYHISIAGDRDALLKFDPDDQRVVFGFELSEDDLAEGTEAFQLGSTPSETGPRYLPPENQDVFASTFVFITDNDLIVVGFETNYTIPEDVGMVNVCGVVTNPPPDEQLLTLVEIIVDTIPQTADEGDYVPIQSADLIFFDQNRRRDCFSVVIKDDNIIEGAEVFSLQLTLFFESDSIVIQPNIATITILDDDAVNVTFLEPIYTVMESDGQREVCITKDLETAVEITVPYFTMDLTATDGRDYIGMEASLILGPEAGATNCTLIEIVSDSEVEEEESFLVLLDLPVDNAAVVRGNPGETTIIITDIIQLQVNDSLIGDPLITVPILVSQEDLSIFNVTQLSLCYEIHGSAGEFFNLVSDQCTSVNGLYTNLNESLNVITEIGIRAVDDSQTCKNIQVTVEGCAVWIDGIPLNTSRYRSNGIYIRKVGNRVRISVPNCNELTLVMWLVCQTAELDDLFTGDVINGEMIDFHVMRGLNFGHSEAHGLIGQFWNLPIRVLQFSGLRRDGSPAPDNTYEVRITSRTGEELVLRTLTGLLDQFVWDGNDGPCLYVGNRQGGPVYEVANPNDPVIEGIYKDYRVPGLFNETGYVFAQFSEGQCV